MTPTINPSPASRITVARNVTNQTACTKERGGSKSKHLVQPAQNREADLSLNIYITICTKQRGGSKSKHLVQPAQNREGDLS